jgi:hypothetical protein
MVNIVVKGIMMKEEPNPVSHDLKVFVSMIESSFIDLCDSSNKDSPSLPNVVVLFCVNSQPAKEQPLHLHVLQVAPSVPWRSFMHLAFTMKFNIHAPLVLNKQRAPK